MKLPQFFSPRSIDIAKAGFTATEVKAIETIAKMIETKYSGDPAARVITLQQLGDLAADLKA
jgi:hypothetical protein